MPTIDGLVPAAASADADLIPVSQSGTMRRVTREQLLDGTQVALALAQGQVLGRSIAGTGGPEALTVGANLRLAGGVLSGVPGFSVGGLPAGLGVLAGDQVAVSQAAGDARISVGQLLAGLAVVPGLDLSEQVARGAGSSARRLNDWFGDALLVEDFGAVGDGSTDDSAAIDRAASSGRPVRFGAKTYVLNGQWTVTRAAVLLGVAGQTVLKRVSQSGGAWISAGGPSFIAAGIVFDAGTLPGESWGVLVAQACTQSLFEECWFRGASGPTLGCGLTIGARDGLTGSPSQHVVRGCTASGNAAHGIWVQAAAGAVVSGCMAYDNGEYGICMDFNDPAFQQQVRHGAVSGCRAWGNRRGISIGNYNETNLQPPRWGNDNPDAVGVVVNGNRCHDNSDYGIAVSGLGMQVVGNLVEGNGSGMLANAAASLLAGNVAVGPGQFGIDAGGSEEVHVSGNLVRGFNVGINPGGSRNVLVSDNLLDGNVWGVTAYGMETDGNGVPFGIACTGLGIERNRVVLKDTTGGGVLLVDAPQGTTVEDNGFFAGAGSGPDQALWAHTDDLVVEGNRWNGQSRFICNPVAVNGQYQVQAPDMIDVAMITSASQSVDSLVGMHQASMAGRVAFIKVVSGGSGYTQASVAIAGAGNGAAATALVRDGAVIAVAVQNGGSGYGTGGATVTIAGDGQGAQGVATVGLPVTTERRMRLHCNCAVRFKRLGSSPFQDNWTGTDILVPQASVVDWVGTWGGWQAVAFPPADYLSPAGDGSFALRSAAGDVVVRPAAGGTMRVSSDTEAIGFSLLLGRGSPEGVVAAAPGSDYRNLDGGVGSTLWVKRVGTDSSGWAAVA